MLSSLTTFELNGMAYHIVEKPGAFLDMHGIRVLRIRKKLDLLVFGLLLLGSICLANGTSLLSFLPCSEERA